MPQFIWDCYLFAVLWSLNLLISEWLLQPGMLVCRIVLFVENTLTLLDSRGTIWSG
jgi:hypothetical protein